MFSDYEAKTISFYKKKKNINEEEKEIQTNDFQIECEDKLIQTQIRKEKLTQTDISEMSNLSKSIKFDNEKLNKFLERVFWY
jgi:hypothetical protein